MYIFAFITVLMLFLSGCCDSGYHPAYIISDKSHEEGGEDSGSR